MLTTPSTSSAKEQVEAFSPLSPVSKGWKQETALTEVASPEKLPLAIQVCTYAAEEDATHLAERIRQENLNAFVKKTKRSTSKIYYTVFIGRFKDYQEAQKTLSQFRKKEISRNFQDAFIRTLEPASR